MIGGGASGNIGTRSANGGNSGAVAQSILFLTSGTYTFTIGTGGAAVTGLSSTLGLPGLDSNFNVGQLIASGGGSVTTPVGQTIYPSNLGGKQIPNSGGSSPLVPNSGGTTLSNNVNGLAGTAPGAGGGCAVTTLGESLTSGAGLNGQLLIQQLS
jgi:hypothetical protein